MSDELDSDPRKVTMSGNPPAEGMERGVAPQPIDPATGMHKDYWVLSEAERAKGFVRPLRPSYRHLPCGAITHMVNALAESYARDPKFYGATFCAQCQSHFRLSEFVWLDGQAVGS